MRRSRMKKSIIISLISVLILTGFSTGSGKSSGVDKARNIILLIGDGMGLSQISSSYYFGDEEPPYARFEHIGLMNSSSAKQKITDSAAGATAYSCGIRTGNGMLGVDEAGNAVENIVEIISRQGMKSGLVSSSPITHATPAAFYAHIDDRGRQDDIALQLLQSDIDFFIGGGKEKFNKRKDGRDLFNENHDVILDTSGVFTLCELEKDRRYGFLYGDYGMPRVQDGRGEKLQQAFSLALDHLNGCSTGFFLMVEGAQIDWGGHENNFEYFLAEQLDFDACVEIALDHAEKTGNTLVIVLADHETGGLALTAGQKENGKNDYSGVSPIWATSGHTAALLPVFSYGPGAAEFRGLYNNDKIFLKMLNALGL